MYIDGNWVENTPRWLSKPGYTLQHPQNTPGNSKNTPRHPKHTPWPPGTALTNPKHSSDILRGVWVVKGCQGGLWGNESGRSCLLNVRDACECLGLPWQCLGYVRGDFGVSGDIWGCLGGVGGCKRGSEGCLVVCSFQFPSILGNHKWYPWHFTIDLEVSDVLNIKMPQQNGHFDLLGTLWKGFKAEI